MPGKTSALDKYANIAAIKVIESGAHTQTSAKFNFPFSIMDKMGLLISRVEYDFANQNAALTAGGAGASALLTTKATVSDPLDYADPSIIDSFRIDLEALTAVAGWLNVWPYVKDFSSLPQGGILVAPAPLYAMVQGGATAAAALTLRVRIYYTYMSLAESDYWQLVESRNIISS